MSVCRLAVVGSSMLAAVIGLVACEQDEGGSSSSPPDGFGIRPGATYPVSYDYSRRSNEFPEDDPNVPGPVLVWDRAKNKVFDYDDEFTFHLHEHPYPTLPDPPVGEDGRTKPCEPRVLIESSESTAVPACRPFPAQAAQSSCEAMLKLAAMGCKQLCSMTQHCPLAFPMVPPLAQSWACTGNPGSTAVKCKGLVECRCGPEP